jgi:hypothetical protein
MRLTYWIKYRQPGQVFWRKVRNVIGDGVEAGLFRFVQTEDDTLIYFSLDAEVIFPAQRQKVIAELMSKEAGQQVQRA